MRLRRDKKRECCRSPQLAIVVPTRSWRGISWWKTQQTKNSLNLRVPVSKSLIRADAREQVANISKGSRRKRLQRPSVRRHNASGSRPPRSAESLHRIFLDRRLRGEMVAGRVLPSLPISVVESMRRSGRVVECDGLEIRQVVLPPDTNQQLTAQSITQIWGVLGGFGSKMCNRMCNSVMRIPDHADQRSGPWRSGFQTDGDH
jgi:hypothetical protein